MTTSVVGERGQITIPKDIRNRLGIKPKMPINMEVTADGLLIRPTVTVPLRRFSDEFIQEIVAEDTLAPDERKKLLRKWRR